jgi:hypothetical protein
MSPENYCESYQKNARKRLNQRLLNAPATAPMQAMQLVIAMRTLYVRAWAHSDLPPVRSWSTHRDFDGKDLDIYSLANPT